MLPTTIGFSSPKEAAPGTFAEISAGRGSGFQPLARRPGADRHCNWCAEPGAGLLLPSLFHRQDVNLGMGDGFKGSKVCFQGEAALEAGLFLHIPFRL